MPLLLGMDRSNLTNPPSNIEMQSTTTSTNTHNLYSSSGHHSSVAANTMKPQAQYPGSILSNFIRANSSLPPSSTAAAATTSTPQNSSRSTTSSSSSLSSLQQQQTSLTGLQTGLTTSQTSGGIRNEISGAEGSVAGRVFGDLVAGGDGGTRTSEQAMEVVERTSVAAKKKKKKKSKVKGVCVCVCLV